MTKQEWKKAEESFSLFNGLKFEIDGFEISLHAEPYMPKNKIYLAVYVNGWSKGEWLTKDCPERQFYYKKTKIHRTHTEKELRKLTREFGKKFADKFAPSTYSYYTFHYPSFAAFKRTMLALNKEIKLITEI